MLSSTKIITFLISLILIGGFLIADLPNAQTRVSFLDVGQGDSIFVRTPDDYFILIDGGPSMNVLERITDVMPRYNRTIDLVVLTHPHADHVNGLVEVLKRYEVRKLMIVGTHSWNPYYQKLLELEVPIVYAKADHDFKIGSYFYLDIVWPERSMAGKEVENLNNASVVLRLIGANFSFMLSGDAETEEETEMVESGFDLSADILKAGHHGSRTASSGEFLDAVSPSIVVIQSGEGNSFGHPHKESLQKYMERGLEVRRNDIEGRVDFIFEAL
jgi:competence protein ComEC